MIDHLTARGKQFADRHGFGEARVQLVQEGFDFFTLGTAQFATLLEVRPRGRQHAVAGGAETARERMLGRFGCAGFGVVEALPFGLQFLHLHRDGIRVQSAAGKRFGIVDQAHARLVARPVLPFGQRFQFPHGVCHAARECTRELITQQGTIGIDAALQVAGAGELAGRHGRFQFADARGKAIECGLTLAFAFLELLVQGAGNGAEVGFGLVFFGQQRFDPAQACQPALLEIFQLARAEAFGASFQFGQERDDGGVRFARGHGS